MSRRDLLDEVAAADHIGMSVAFLRAARCRGKLGNRTQPPPSLQIGRAIRYDRNDLDVWLSACRIDPANRHQATTAA
jgi:hypothetical protein